ncbi:MAG: P-loop NTPase fold protein [Cyanobacteria bacterium P01_F01_bin.86]
MDVRLKAFKEAYSNLNLRPLRGEKERSRFRVEYGSPVVEELKQLIEDDDTEDGKTIFSGHRGCGKSTLLAEFGRQCEADGYFVVFFSIADTIEMSDVDHISTLFAIAVNLMDEAEKANVRISDSAKKAFREWFATKTQTDIKEASVSGEAEFDLFAMIKNKLKVSSVTRNELKQEFEKNPVDLVAQINAIAAAIQNATDKSLLVIIDDLDKLDLGLVRNMYYNHIKTLFLPGFRIIYTTPMAALRDKQLQTMMITETNNQIVEMPVVKLFKQATSRTDAPDPVDENQKTLCEILNRRVPTELMEPEIANAIMLKSGGVLRELIRLANKCCRLCLQQLRRPGADAELKIDREIFEQAVTDIRLDYEAPLGKADYAILKRTYEAYAPEDPEDQKFLDLLHSLHVLKYRNGDIWYDLHPIVMDLLKRKKIIEA